MQWKTISVEMASQDGEKGVPLPSTPSTLYVHRRAHTTVNIVFFLRHYVNCSTGRYAHPAFPRTSRPETCGAYFLVLLIHLPDGL